jgi:predicted nucleic acid-binding protein
MSNATPANKFVVDTVALVLRLEGRKMGATAKTFFEAAETGDTTLYVPAMVLAEILYLSEKGRITASPSAVGDYMRRHPHYQEYPLNLAVIQSAAQITDVPELHDRLIAGTARLLGLELLTDDSAIQASTFVKTVW